MLAVALLVAAVGSASATTDGEAPLVLNPDQSGSLGVVSTAQSDTEISPESDTQRRLVGRESSERVDGVVIALWSIAAGMTVMLVLFLWHTSPRRRLRLARRRSAKLYDGEADLAEAAAGEGSADDAEVVDDAAAAMQDAEAVAVVAAGADDDPQPSEPELPTAWEEPAAAESADEDEAEPETEPVDAEPPPEEAEPPPVGEDSGPTEPVLPTAWEELEVEQPELPPVWEDEAEPASEKADPADSGPANESPEAGRAGGERRSRFWMQLRRTLGLD